MHVELIVDNKRSNVRKLVIRESALIGRGTNCDVRIISSEISREHCRIAVDDGEMVLVDLGSTNGTFINGEKAEAEKEVSISDQSRIHIGPAVFNVVFVHDEDSAQANAPQLADLVADCDEEYEYDDEEDALDELPIEIQDDVGGTLSALGAEAFEDIASAETIDASELAGVASDPDMPAKTEETAFDEFLKGI